MTRRVSVELLEKVLKGDDVVHGFAKRTNFGETRGNIRRFARFVVRRRWQQRLKLMERLIDILNAASFACIALLDEIDGP